MREICSPSAVTIISDVTVSNSAERSAACWSFAAGSTDSSSATVASTERSGDVDELVASGSPHAASRSDAALSVASRPAASVLGRGRASIGVPLAVVPEVSAGQGVGLEGGTRLVADDRRAEIFEDLSTD
jgi:hypothetical protein